MRKNKNNSLIKKINSIQEYEKAYFPNITKNTNSYSDHSENLAINSAQKSLNTLRKVLAS